MTEVDERLRSLELSRESALDHAERLKKLEETMSQLATAVASVTKEVETNTQLTRDIKSILVTAKVMTTVIKWAAASVIGAAALWESFKHLANMKLP